VRTVAPGTSILPAGRPLAGVRTYVLDPHLRLLPPGVPGELFAGGDRLARGYLGRPDLTAERFVPDPFGPLGGRLYATGDLARFLPGGELEILGRRDQQVKIRGFRIEPGEIEAALGEHPGVAQAAVIVREDTPGEKRLVAFVVPRGPAEAAELRAWLAGRLPAFLVPAAIELRPELPVTPNGKIDRAALVRPGSTVRASGAAPRTLAEELLAVVWADLLHVERPRPDDGFFDLGGHSLLAARMVARVREAFGVDLPLRAVFEAPTLAGLAARIESLARAEASDAPWSPLVRLAAGPERESPLFCVHGAGGNVAVFADLARLLEGERPVYALEARGLAPGQIPLDRIEEMAELYLAAVREVRPRGPYRLLGYSMGGKVAFEMARWLQDAGETVDLLALVDIPATVPDDAEEPLEPEVPDLPGIDPETVRRHLAVWRANRDATRHWTPSRSEGRALLILAEEGAGGTVSEDPALGWGEAVAGGVEVVRVSGGHFSVLARPYVDAVAAALRRE
jgi:thioesterase domain-containing protein/acyl carrier protein